MASTSASLRGAGLALLLVCASAPARGRAQAPIRSFGTPLLENQYVTVRSIQMEPGRGLPGADRHDLALVYLDGEPAGRVLFVGAGADVTGLPAGRVIVVELEDRPMASYRNESGYPPAFPRPGAKRLVDNPRVTIWDYTYTQGEPTPMHYHDRDVVVVFLGDGALASTAPDGKLTVTPHANGVTRFNPGNRLHTETLVGGQCRVIVVELKGGVLQTG
jgi:hypothetical protein